MRPLPLYDAALLERAKRPVGAGELPEPRRRGRAENALCGDEIEVDVRVADGRIRELAHRVRGCAIVAASASLLAETASGDPVEVTVERARALQAWLSAGGALPRELSSLEPTRLFPARARCVLLPWDALERALAPVDAP